MNSYSDIKDSLMTSEKQQQIMDFKNFRALPADISNRDMEEIKSELLRRHLEWRGSEEQVDDILVTGIRV